jgi:AcrR family transcriptional regulator
VTSPNHQPDRVALTKGALNEARWSEILDAAEQMFCEVGYEATTIEEIASRVGLLKGSLYYYIQNKADVFYHISARSLTRHLRALQDDPGVCEGETIPRLLHFIDQYMYQLDTSYKGIPILARDVTFLDADQKASLTAIRQQIHLMLKEILAQGVREGSFDSTLDTSVATNSILSLMNNTRGWYRPTGRRSSREIQQWYKKFILKGLAAEG